MSEEKRKEIEIKKDKASSQNDDDDDSQATVPMPITGLKIKQDKTHSLPSTLNPNKKQATGTNIHQSNVDTGDDISSSSHLSFPNIPSESKQNVDTPPPHESVSSIHKSGPKVTEKINYKQFIEIAKNKTDTLLGNHNFENFFEVPI